MSSRCNSRIKETRGESAFEYFPNDSDPNNEPNWKGRGGPPGVILILAQLVYLFRSLVMKRLRIKTANTVTQYMPRYY